MLQSRYLKQNDPCDDCLILFQQCLQCFACILRMAGSDQADEVTFLSDIVNCCVCSCALAQHQVEMDYIKDQGLPTHEDLLSCLPPKQEEMASAAKKVRA